jgi:TolB protein
LRLDRNRRFEDDGLGPVQFASLLVYRRPREKRRLPPIRLTPPLTLIVAQRLLLQAFGVALIAACSGDDPTGPSMADWHGGRRIAVAAVNGKIAFESQRDGNAEIYVMNPDGTGETNLTDNPSLDTTPAWSPDGTKIAFSSLRTGDLEIFVMNADGTNPVNLTNSANTDLAPTWSPDGTKIAFHTFRDAGIGLQSEIYVMNANGSGQTNLSQDSDIDVFPSWSPDGTKIAFVRIPVFSSDAEIFVMDPDGTDQANLTNNPASDGNASWSPTASEIAFGSSRDDNFGEVYRMNVDGSGVVRLTNSAGGDGEPAWSPDGTQIAFTTARDGDLQIYSMNTDGSGQSPLTAPPGRNALSHWGVAPGSSPTTCAEGVSEARSRIAQLLPNEPFLRLFLNFFLFRMQGGAPNAETNFGLLLDYLVRNQLMSAEDAAELKDLVSPC